MAKLRKFVAYRHVKRPYTRKSKYKVKNYVRAFPNIKIVKFEAGDKKKNYESHIVLKSKQALQIRHEALESSRMTINRKLEKVLGKNQFFFRVRPYPHHVLRENAMATGAGADRMSTGMAKPFGKVVGAAAQIKEGQIIMDVYTVKGNEMKVKDAYDTAARKLPGAYSIAYLKHEGPVI